MAEAYIANRPVRFDRDYMVGERIPRSAVDPNMVGKLAAMGRILCVDLPENGENAPLEADKLENAASAPEGVGKQGNAENAPESVGKLGSVECLQEARKGVPSGDRQGGAGKGDFACKVCGKAFGSKNALAAHARFHKA